METFEIDLLNSLIDTSHNQLIKYIFVLLVDARIVPRKEFDIHVTTM